MMACLPHREARCLNNAPTLSYGGRFLWTAPIHLNKLKHKGTSITAMKSSITNKEHCHGDSMRGRTGFRNKSRFCTPSGSCAILVLILLGWVNPVYAVGDSRAPKELAELSLEELGNIR